MTNEIADHLCHVFYAKTLEDMPENVPPLSGERTQADMVDIAKYLITIIRNDFE